MLWQHASPKLSADAAAASALPTHMPFRPVAFVDVRCCRHTCVQCQKVETPGGTPARHVAARSPEHRHTTPEHLHVSMLLSSARSLTPQNSCTTSTRRHAQPLYSSARYAAGPKKGCPANRPRHASQLNIRARHYAACSAAGARADPPKLRRPGNSLRAAVRRQASRREASGLPPQGVRPRRRPAARSGRWRRRTCARAAPGAAPRTRRSPPWSRAARRAGSSWSR